MLYRLLKPAVSFATGQYFREIRVVGAAPVPRGPLLIVANHPNVMLDGLLIIRIFPQSMRFIAKSTIFRGKMLSALLHQLHLVPVKRRSDHALEGVDNEDSFQYVARCLNGGGTILIFPEGANSMMRKLLPVKTGAARIAFRTEQEAGFSAELLIQPVGITYSDFYRMQSSVTVRLEEPIRVAEYEDIWNENPRTAVRSLSDEIAKRLRQATVEVRASHYIALVNKISKLAQSKGIDVDDRDRIRAVAREVERHAPKHPKKIAELERRLDQYLHLSGALRLDGSRSFDIESNRLLLFLLAPFVVAGVVLHVLPYVVVARLVNRRAADRSHLGSWQVSLGFCLFPLWYVLLGWIAAHQRDSTIFGVGFALAAAACGYLANRYFHQLLLLSFSLFWPAKRSPVEVLKEIRDDLWEELQDLRQQ